VADEIKMTSRDSWILSVLARLPKPLRAADKEGMARYIEELTSEDLKDAGRVLLEQKAEDAVESGVLEIVVALREWAERNKRVAV
jgi:hypothetical protein